MKISNVTLQLDTVGVLTRMVKSGGEQGKVEGPCVIIPVRYKLLPCCRRSSCCCCCCFLLLLLHEYNKWLHDKNSIALGYMKSDT